MNYTVNFAILLIGLMSGVLTARSLGAAGKGEVAIAQAFVGMAAFVLSLSLDQAYIFVAARTTGFFLIGRALRHGLAVGSIVGMLIAIAAVLLGSVLPGGSMIYILTATSVPFSTSGLYALSVLQGWGDLRWNRLRFLPQGGYLIGLVGVATFSHLTPMSTIVCFVAGAAAFWLVMVIVSCGHVWSEPESAGLSKRREAASIRLLLRYGCRSHISSVQSVINTRADVSVMAFFTTTTVIGRYSVAVSLVAPLAMIGPAVAAYLFPRMASSGRVANIDGVVKSVAITTAICAAIWAILTPMLLGPVFGSSFTGLAPTIGWLCAAMVPLSLGYVLFAWWKGQDRPGRPAWAEAGAMLTMALLLPWLVSSHGAAGAAVVSMCGYTVSSLIVFAMYLRATRRRPDMEHGGSGRANRRISRGATLR